MRKVLSSNPDVAYYYDDVLIASQTWEQHCGALREVFRRIGQAGLTVQPAKCELGMQEVSFLGHLIRSDEKTTIAKTAQRILDAPRPTTKRQVRSFWGLTGYYREFVPNYSHVDIPLSDLTKKEQPTAVKWGDEQEAAFAGLKERLANALILRLPDFEREFVLRADASDRGLGAVLMQRHSEKLHHIAYAIRKLLPPEAAYSTFEKEALALVWGIEKLQSFLYGRRFLVLN